MLKILGNLQKYSRLTFIVDSNVEYVKIIRPDGKIDTVETFEYQPVNVLYDDEGIEKIEKKGSAQNYCRYTPDFYGRATVKAFSFENKIDEINIDIDFSDSHGYVKVSERDGKYFAYSDGTPFILIGINAAFPTSYGKTDGTEFGRSSVRKYLGLRQYERWFKKLSQNGCNMARVWLGHEYFTPDTENVYCFDKVQFTKIDMLLELAKKYHIKLKFTIEQFRFFDYHRCSDSDSYADDIFRKFNKKLYCDGKRCESIGEWLNNPKWRAAWLAKVGEFAKRYSGDTEIFAIELWNEMNCLGDFGDICEWNRQVMPEVRKMFPKNLVVNSLGSLDCEGARICYNSFGWEEFSFVQIHRYLDAGAWYKDCRESPFEMIKGAFEKVVTDKPVLIAETGAVNNCHSGPFKYYVNDDDGLIFADTVYTPLFLKSCGVGNIWHWDERYIESKNLYRMFKPISKLVENIEFDKEEFKPIDLSNDDTFAMLLSGNTAVLGYIRNKNYNWKTVMRDLSEVMPVSSFELRIDNLGSVRIFKVWDSDRTAVESEDNRVIFSNIGIGTLFRADLKH